MIESKSIDLARSVNPAGEIIHFTDTGDTHWAGIVDLRAHELLPRHLSSRIDLYILQGELIENQSFIHASGTFLRRGIGATLIAGAQGTRLFKYLDSELPSGPVTVTPSQRNWQSGGAVGMKVASLIDADHRLMLVSWRRGTQMRSHDHPRGEEIFVLSGELRDERGGYPAGTWQRLYPQTSHSPYSQTETLILLRNGHLSPEKNALCRNTRP